MSAAREVVDFWMKVSANPPPRSYCKKTSDRGGLWRLLSAVHLSCLGSNCRLLVYKSLGLQCTAILWDTRETWEWWAKFCEK